MNSLCSVYLFVYVCLLFFLYHVQCIKMNMMTSLCHCTVVLKIHFVDDITSHIWFCERL